MSINVCISRITEIETPSFLKLSFFLRLNKEQLSSTIIIPELLSRKYLGLLYLALDSPQLSNLVRNEIFKTDILKNLVNQSDYMQHKYFDFALKNLSDSRMKEIINVLGSSRSPSIAVLYAKYRRESSICFKATNLIFSAANWIGSFCRQKIE